MCNQVEDIKNRCQEVVDLVRDRFILDATEMSVEQMKMVLELGVTVKAEK